MRPKAVPLGDGDLESVSGTTWWLRDGAVVADGVDLEAEQVAAGLAGVASPVATIAREATKASVVMGLADGTDLTPSVVLAAGLIGSPKRAIKAARDPMTLWLLTALDARCWGAIGSHPWRVQFAMAHKAAWAGVWVWALAVTTLSAEGSLLPALAGAVVGGLGLLLTGAGWLWAALPRVRVGQMGRTVAVSSWVRGAGILLWLSADENLEQVSIDGWVLGGIRRPWGWRWVARPPRRRVPVRRP